MAFHTLIAFLKVLLMQFVAAPGFGTVAVVAQITFRLDHTGRFTGMTAHTRQVAIALSVGRMLLMHSLPGKRFLLVTQGTILDLGRPGMIAEFGERYHAGSIRGLAGVIMAFTAGRGHG